MKVATREMLAQDVHDAQERLEVVMDTEPSHEVKIAMYLQDLKRARQRLAAHDNTDYSEHRLAA